MASLPKHVLRRTESSRGIITTTSLRVVMLMVIIRHALRNCDILLGSVAIDIPRITFRGFSSLGLSEVVVFSVRAHAAVDMSVLVFAFRGAWYIAGIAFCGGEEAGRHGAVGVRDEIGDGKDEVVKIVQRFLP